ncbi:MAG: hypothetical protein WC675_05765 [Patescibacteria group bacterium]|jgi:hypothetical protein
MLVQKKMRGAKRKIMIVVVIGVILVISYLFFNSFIAGKIQIFKPLEVEPIKKLTVPDLNPKFDYDFLTKTPYTELKMSSRAKLPVEVDKIGRENPFAEIKF